ncbi:MAG: GTPase ObgE [Patescibacteria group bacterium]|nr:GTPase ObgE [Patescibacteria group bacterium]
MLIDDVKIKIKAGDGGRGAVAFNKNMLSLGPSGGSGGSGGSIYFEGVSDLNALSQFRYKKEIKAQKGGDGKPQFNDGADVGNLILKIPIGTVVYNLNTNQIFEITKIGEKILAAKGGRGGKGNYKFRSPTNTSPKQFKEGTLGEEFDMRLELKLIADIGFVGLPNVGKSSLLNELTNAKSKVANYPFTTLEPNLGSYYELILADIPGLIKGAFEGKGLGIKFLNHIERTKIIFHFISSESENPSNDYKTVKKELELFNKELIKKPEYLFLTKTDMITLKKLREKLTALKKLNKSIVPISIYDWNSLEKVKKILNKIKKEK